jgi:hypothetical protein
VLEEELGPAVELPAVPRRPAFPPGRRARVPSADVNLPPPLPILASPVPDRASLEDATAGVSAKAALAARMPLRTTPAAHARLSVPEPYEHRRPLTRPVPAEDSSPVVRSPWPPK